MKRKGFLFCCISLFGLLASAQTTFPLNGTTNPINTYYAFLNATIVSDYEHELNNATLLIQNQKIVAIGQQLTLPVGTVTLDLKGKFIYPSFIDLYSDYGLTSVKSERRGYGPQMESNMKGAYGWNQAIKSDQAAYRNFVHQPDKAAELHKAGIATVLTAYKDGIVRGSGALIVLNNKKENESMLIDQVAAFYSFSKGSSTQDYPSSLTGAIALLRQSFYDATWYQNNKQKTEYNISLDELHKLKSLPAIFDANDKYNCLRAAKLGKEFNINFIIKASGNEYQRIEEIKNSGANFILPLNFPDPYEVEDPIDAEAISLADLKHWELAPYNAAAFEANNINFCFTSYDLKDKTNLLKQVRKCIHYGLSRKAALKALTFNPASFINAQNKIGALKENYTANFFISDKNIFDDDAQILEHWLGNDVSRFAEINPTDIRGNYVLSIGSYTYPLKFNGELTKIKLQINVDTVKRLANFSFAKDQLSFSFAQDSILNWRASLIYDAQTKQFNGKAQRSNGDWLNTNIRFLSELEKTSSPKAAAVNSNSIELGNTLYPFSAYGSDKAAFLSFQNTAGDLLIKDANVWTALHDSVLKEYDVLIINGKIKEIAKDIQLPPNSNVQVINAKGKHLTPGIIDEHSHIALKSGVNEGAQASSAEVRMGDVINPEDINIYRQLSGGVTAAQLLHGSANPIGGQSAIIKLKWGANAEDMKFANADGFIKFALGENVKQSNWGDQNVVRFPQSRMGVEQVYVDFFTRAKEYDFAKQTAAKSSDKNVLLAFRRDLELDALAEILNKKRFITCHSYVQSEINMLMHVANQFGFRVNTFTHILEGYKVADKMKAHGVAASTFADWWAYKNEVMEAIPYNAAILTRMGVVTALNSDDAEMARRLNQEAAKAIKYGALSEVEALKLVTLNPAIMLHLDKQVGSIEPGKSGDVVLWNNHPLSVFAKVEQTIIDGKIYFDRKTDSLRREEMKVEKARLVAKLIKENKRMGGQKSGRTQKPQSKNERLYHCNTIEGVEEELTGQR
ncbi:MAG: amidohydrolase family protein [Bacteroidota bacterium]